MPTSAAILSRIVTLADKLVASYPRDLDFVELRRLIDRLPAPPRKRARDWGAIKARQRARRGQQ
jgi:hypothetical protein